MAMRTSWSVGPGPAVTDPHLSKDLVSEQFADGPLAEPVLAAGIPDGKENGPCLGRLSCTKLKSDPTKVAGGPLEVQGLGFELVGGQVQIFVHTLVTMQPTPP